MRIPLSWLRDYVDIHIPVEDLAERLTLAGLEVESIEYIGLAPRRAAGAQAKTEAPAPGGLVWDRDKIVVAAVLEVKPHPNADRLVLADVDYGGAQPHVVVTGAPNLFGYKGQGRLANPPKVAFAKTGATLYDGHQAGQVLITLKPAKIRGVMSDAMVCSEKELGISDEHEGIMFLPDDAPVGMPLADYMGDAVLSLDIKGGFGHLQCVIGVAREAAALLGVPLKRDVLTVLERAPVEITAQPGFIELEIADPDLCGRYSAALIRGVQIGPSPFWMQQRLLRAGMRPINNIVDITNYVMLELGQPLHAFDYHRLNGRRPGRPTIIVRRARPGETMTTLDGQLRQLDPDMLLITDGAGPVAIAGVMGGLESEVAESTTDILLESANFDFLNNRRTSQVLNLKSEAALRFGRRIDPELTVKALARAGQLMEQLAGGQVEPVYGDVYPGRREPVVISFDPAYANRLLGVDVPVEEIVRILTALEFGVQRSTPEAGAALTVSVPSHRLDVTLPADLAEEIARVHGYDRFPSTLLRDELPPQRDNPRLAGRDRVRDVLVSCGLDEIIAYSLTTEAREALLEPPGAPRGERPYLRVVNPISADKVVLRRTLLASALDTLAANLRFAERVALFEVGAVYLPRQGQPLPDEAWRLSLAMTGPRQEESWHAVERALLDFGDIKGVMEVLVERLHLSDVCYEPADHPTYHPGRAAWLVVGGQRAGVFGELHPLVRRAFDLPEQPVCAAEFDLDRLLDAASGKRAYKPISRYPLVREDIAVVVDEAVPAAQVEAAICKSGGSLLRETRLFDVYRGPQLGAGKKSLAYRLVYQAADRTLTDDEAGQVRQGIVKALERELGAVLRSA